MARLLVHADRLEVQLSAAEKTLALHRHDIVVPRSSIRTATITQDPWVWVRGIRAPGTHVPLTLAVGTWKHHNGTDFVLIKGKRPAVVIELKADDSQPYGRLILSTPHAVELIASLKLSDAG